MKIVDMAFGNLISTTVNPIKAGSKIGFFFLQLTKINHTDASL